MWVSSEVAEEITEILAMIEDSGMNPREIRVDGPAEVLGKLALPVQVGGAPVVVVPFNHPVGIKKLAKVLGVLTFVIRLARHRPRLLFSGFSLLKHRLAAAMFRVRHVAYIRGALFDSTIRGGLSDRIQSSRLASVLPRTLFQSFSADVVLTVGDLNRDVLNDRGIPLENIRVVGAIWLRALGARANDAPSSVEPRRAIFITTAWAAHGHMAEEAAQQALVHRLVEDWSAPLPLELRIHPRDQFDYDSDPVFATTRRSTEPSTEFLATLEPSDVLISPLSTLAFEAISLGVPVAFYIDPVATAIYAHVYEQLNLDPMTVDELTESDFTARGTQPQILARYDPAQLHGLL